MPGWMPRDDSATPAIQGTFTPASTAVANGTAFPDSDSLRVHIHGLRAVIDKPFPVPYIQTRHGIGYRIAAPDGSN